MSGPSPTSSFVHVSGTPVKPLLPTDPNCHLSRVCYVSGLSTTCLSTAPFSVVGPQLVSSVVTPSYTSLVLSHLSVPSEDPPSLGDVSQSPPDRLADRSPPYFVLGGSSTTRRDRTPDVPSSDLIFLLESGEMDRVHRSSPDRDGVLVVHSGTTNPGQRECVTP